MDLSIKQLFFNSTFAYLLTNAAPRVFKNCILIFLIIHELYKFGYFFLTENNIKFQEVTFLHFKKQEICNDKALYLKLAPQTHHITTLS